MSIHPKFEMGEQVKLFTHKGDNIRGKVIDRESIWMRIHVYKVRDEMSNEETGYLDYYATEDYLGKIP